MCVAPGFNSPAWNCTLDPFDALKHFLSSVRTRYLYVKSGIGTTYGGRRYLKCQLTGANGGAQLSVITRGRAGLGTRRPRNKARPVVDMNMDEFGPRCTPVYVHYTRIRRTGRQQ